MRTLQCALLVFLASSLVVATASDDRGYFSTIGVGGQSCGSFLDARKASSSHPFGHWVGGYLTAYNVLQPATFDITGTTDIQGVMYWVENSCRENPTKGFAIGVIAAVAFLQPNQTSKKPG